LTCSIDGCTRPVRYKSGLCGAHHMRQVRGMELEAPVRERKKTPHPRTLLRLLKQAREWMPDGVEASRQIDAALGRADHG
jgi:hypothetical protein